MILVTETETVVSVHIAPSGAPEVFTVVARQREVAFSWSPPPLAQLNGIITNYTLSCNPAPSSFPWPSPHSSPITILGFSPDTTYSCSVVANNGLGSGPPSNVTFLTQHDCMLTYPILSLTVRAIYFIVRFLFSNKPQW